MGGAQQRASMTRGKKSPFQESNFIAKGWKQGQQAGEGRQLPGRGRLWTPGWVQLSRNRRRGGACGRERDASGLL